MNYRHAYHAGNFADLVKHGVMLALLRDMKTDARPFTLVDTHAGAGLYDLSDPDAARSKEAEAGVKRLLAAAPDAAFAPLREALHSLNGGPQPRMYPGSPWLAAWALRRGDRYVGCELRADDHGRLATTLKRFAAPRGVLAEARREDGYSAVAAVARQADRLCVLIDPPFEQPNDYVRAAAASAAVLEIKPPAPVAIWTPLKDLETFDGFLRRLEGLGQQPALVAEARLRPLVNPMKMNGCAMVVLNPPDGLRADAEDICRAVVSGLGDAGGAARVWSLES